jgi:hypothetical protein
VTGGIIAPREEDLVILTTLERLVKGNRRAHELLFDTSKSVKAGLELEMVVAFAFRDGGNDGDVVAFGTNVVSRRHDGNVDVCID